MAGRVAVERIDVPVRAPVWSDSAAGLVALTGADETGPGARLVKIVPARGAGSPARTSVSGALRDSGENIATSPADSETVLVPQPALGRVAVFSVRDLRQVRTVRAGPTPSFVSTQPEARVLLARSADGSTVTGVNLQDGTLVSSHRISLGPRPEVDGAARGRTVSYHAGGRAGIVHYESGPAALSEQSRLPVAVESSVGDLVKSSRAYVAEKGTDRLVAVDSERSPHGLRVVARMHLGEPVRYLGVDEDRVYAATERRLVVLKSNNFEGFHNERFPEMDTIAYRDALPHGPARTAPLSGLAVGHDRVFLTLYGQPLLVSVGKPSL